jgi:NAD(P)H-dependent FMN reductase
MTKIGIIVGSTREGRVSTQVAEWVKDFAEKQNTDAEFELVDIKEYGLDRFNEKLPPAMANKEYSNDKIQAWSEKIDSLDGFIFVTPEYNKNISSSLKDHIDYIASEWNNKSAGIVSYGSTLGIAASMSLRSTLANLKLAIVTPQGAFSLFTDFEEMSTFKPAEVHNATMEAVVTDVVNWAKALKTIR